jgi:hypothetical protein
MNAPQTAKRDERTVAVESASYCWAYILLTYALLVDACYRGWICHENAIDLLVLTILGGVVCDLYQRRLGILARGWMMKAVKVAVIAAVIAAIIGALPTVHT